MGVSIEDSRVIDRADALREVPATIRFLSLEPLIGPIPNLDLKRSWTGQSLEAKAETKRESWNLNGLSTCSTNAEARMSRALSNKWAPNGQSGKVPKAGKAMTSVSSRKHCKLGNIRAAMSDNLSNAEKKN